MKRKLFPLFASIAALAISIAPFAAQAEAPKPLRQEFQEVLAEIGVTEEQKAEIEQIRANTRAQVQEVLTDDQKEQLQAAISNGQGPKEAMKTLDLSEEQQQEIRSIMKSAREEGANILTEEQREQLRAEMRERAGENGGFRRRGR